MEQKPDSDEESPTLWCLNCEKEFYRKDKANRCDDCNGSRVLLREEATKQLLESPKLLERINTELGIKIEGELETRKAIFLFGCIRLVINHGKGISNALLINAKSSVGKDYVSRAVCELHPTNRVENIVRASPNVFTYYKHGDPTFSYDGRICRISDITESLLKSDAFKTFLTDEGKSIITNKSKSGTTEAIEYNVKGKPIIIATTANAEPSEELLNRVNLLQLDETQEQTKAINRRQLRNAERGFDDETNYSPILLFAMERLERVRVIIPFASLLEPHLPQDLRARRDTPRILNLIKASAALHQYSRKRDEKGNVIANADDYENARAALKVIQTGFYVSLTRTARDVWEAAKELFDNTSRSFSAKQLHNFKPVCSLRMLYKHLDKLSQRGMLIGSEEDKNDSFKPVQVYKPVEVEVHSLQLPPFHELNQITNASSASNTSFTSNGSITPLTAGAIETIEAIELQKHVEDAVTGLGQGAKPDSSRAALPEAGGKMNNTSGS